MRTKQPARGRIDPIDPIDSEQSSSDRTFVRHRSSNTQAAGNSTSTMSSSGGVFSDTLQTITTTKLNELSKKRATVEDQKTKLLRAVDNEADQKEKLRILLDGVKQSFAIETAHRGSSRVGGGAGRIINGSSNDPRLVVMLKNVERFLDQARYDPSISPKLLRDWQRTLTEQLNI